ncbi:hypothetical protein BDC45DRAFT_107989 [Circinella umbellata]|nr:hypothetical protein BDC45DRAFT_107989 [Circinella umbellata]
MNFDHVIICSQHTNRQRHSPPSYSDAFTTSFNTDSRDRAIIDSSSYFDEYDHAIESVQLKADLQDYYYGFYNQQQQQRQQNEDSSTECIEQEHQQQRYIYSQHTQQQLERAEKDYYFSDYYNEQEAVEAAVSLEEEEDDRKSASSMESYNNDALLYLILDVQSYISEMSNSRLMNETDSPLFGLQYKMYTYMKQRAFEAGFNVDSLPPPP